MRRRKPYFEDGRWRFQFHGRRYGFPAESQAVAALEQLEAAERPQEAPRGIAGLIASYTARCRGAHATSQLLRFNEFAGHHPLSAVSTRILDDYHEHLRTQIALRRTWNKRRQLWEIKPTGEPLSAETVRKHVAYAAAALHWGYDRGWVLGADGRPLKIPIPKLDVSPLRPKPIDRDELGDLAGELIGARCKRAAAICRFILESGCRPGEARKLEWSEVDVARRVVVLPENKTARRRADGKPRIFGLSAEALEILRNQPRVNRWVFLSRLGKPYSEKGLGAILRRKGFGIYRLRHTWAQAAADAGIAKEVILDQMGHATSRMVDHYCDVARAHRQRAAESVGGLSRAVLPPATPKAEPGLDRRRRASARTRKSSQAKSGTAGIGRSRQRRAGA